MKKTVENLPGVEDLKGVTKKAKNSLIENGYDTLEKIANASKEDLTKLPFIGGKTAEKILEQAREIVGGGASEEKTTNTKKETKVTKTSKTSIKKERTTKRSSKKKGNKAKKSTVILNPNQLLGYLIAIRASSSGIRHPAQGIVKLVDDLDIEPAILVGKKVKASYPSGKEIRGKVISIFGKKTTKKFVVRFNKNISGELVSREVLLA